MELGKAAMPSKREELEGSYVVLDKGARLHLKLKSCCHMATILSNKNQFKFNTQGGGECGSIDCNCDIINNPTLNNEKYIMAFPPPDCSSGT